MWKRFAVLALAFGIAFSCLYMRVFNLSEQEGYKQAGVKQGSYTINVSKTYGNIYDCNLRLLNNNTKKILAVIDPSAENVRDIQPYLIDKDAFYKQVDNGLPFVCEVNTLDIPNKNILTFETTVRTTESQLAPHIVGYSSDNKGVSGIEGSFNDFLRNNVSSTSVTYSIDGLGKTLDGVNKVINLSPAMKAGVITTIDSDIQHICEEASKKIEKGAIIVMEPSTGRIKAVVSAPTFTPLNVAESLNDKNSPLINRAFSAYNVGSIFKLVTAATALEQGISPDLKYECNGKIDVDGQIFKCHKLSGHGVLDMQGAMVNSCNTYFINLSEQISSENFISKASILGFGRSTVLAPDIISAKGKLQTVSDLYNPAEKANLAFGQGMLMATPLQIATMTSAIVNGGKMPKPQLVIGTTKDCVSVDTLGFENLFTDAIDPSVAHTLRKFMVETVNNNVTSDARPYNTTAGGKTSTAQTGQYNTDGSEILQAWFTGYFPTDKPKYVVTVLAENGKSGNTAAGPIFKEIAEEITKMETK